MAKEDSRIREEMIDQTSTRKPEDLTSMVVEIKQSRTYWLEEESDGNQNHDGPTKHSTYSYKGPQFMVQKEQLNQKVLRPQQAIEKPNANSKNTSLI